MAKRKRAIPQYGTVVLNGIEYYRTRVEDSDGNRVALYAKMNIPPQTGQQNGGNRSRVTVEMSPGVRLQVQAVE